MKSEINKLMADGKTARCCYDMVSDGSRWPSWHQCCNKATCTRNGGMYCKLHDPVEKQRKADAKEKAWKEKLAKAEAGWKKERLIHELFPKLVAALDSYKLSPEHQTIYEQAKAATNL